MKRKDILLEIIVFLFVVLFVYAALMKLMDVEKFQVQLGQSPMLMAFAPQISWLVPIIELVVAAMLIFSRFRLIGLYAAFTLMVMFTVYIIVILTYAQHVPCSCGGILEDMGWTEHLIFNIGFVLFAVGGIVLMNKQEKKDPQLADNNVNYAS
jgi:uncharacterized membrane protein YphA (DoxX/SURF4 family)